MADRYDVNQLLADSRTRISRFSPSQLHQALAAGILVIDTRAELDRQREGVIPGSIPVPLSVLLWRLDPEAESTNPKLNDLDEAKVIVCGDGYSSSWAAATLADLGFTAVSDLDWGFHAWAAEGLPVVSDD
jgi:rhodanese-related sulfurtransferase